MNQAQLTGIERPVVRVYRLNDDEARIVERLRSERRSMHRRRQYLKDAVLAILDYPKSQSRVHRALNLGAAGPVTYYTAVALLNELKTEGRVIKAGRKWRRA